MAATLAVTVAAAVAAAVAMVVTLLAAVAVARTLSEGVPHTIYQKMTLRVLIMLFLCRLVASLHFGFSGGAAAVVLVAACGRSSAPSSQLPAPRGHRFQL